MSPLLRCLRIAGVVAASTILFATATFGVEIAPLAVERGTPLDVDAVGRFSNRTVSVAIEVDRDGARVLAYALKARPFDSPLEIEPPRAYVDGRPIQLEVVLIGAADSRHTRRLDVNGLCLAHAPADEPHVSGDTILLHRESFVVELPERAGMDAVEVAYYEDDSGLPLRRSLGVDWLDAQAFRPGGSPARYADLAFAGEERAAGTEAVTSSTALWPEDFDDEDVYQVFGSEPEAARRINVVIVPDGYTYAQKEVMEAHATDMVNYFRATRPYSEHDPFMNYILVYAYSTESGTDQCDCGIVLDTAMGTRFPLSNPECGHSANRCLYYGSGCDTAGTSNIVEAELRAPYKDTTIVMVNTPRYGGCGGARAVYSAGNSSATDVAVHELGHSLAGLADEYQGNPSCGTSAGGINTSTNENVGAWPEWIADIGAPREGAQYFDLCVYRPLANCEMRSLFQPFCPVCNQRWSLLTFGHPRVAPTAPVESVSPSSPLQVALWSEIEFSVGTRFSVGAAVTNEITWTVTGPGGSPVDVATGTPSLSETFSSEGPHTVEVVVVGDTNFVKPQKYGANRDTALWEIQVSASAPPAEVSPPDAVAPLIFVGPNRISWEHASSSGSTAFNLYSGDLAALPGSFGGCQRAGLSDNESIVFGQPAAGTAKFFLVTGTNSLGEGSLGATSSGSSRVNGTPCN